MPKAIKYIWLLLAVIITASSARASYEGRYLQDNDMPNPLIYLPGPPDSTMIAFNGDQAKWVWGKQQRNTPRGEQASWESKYGIVRMCTIYSDVLGIDITEDGSPAIYRLMKRAGDTGAGSVIAMKTATYRKRPFLIMKEDPWGQYDTYAELANSSSYPSSHTGCGWGTALALAEMAPHMQDTILRRGYEYGMSRVIVGAHWQSDVEAAIMCASAAIARSHATPEYQADLVAARAEYLQLKGLTESDISTNSIPAANRIIPAPARDDTYSYYGEVAPYWQAKTERDTERGSQAIIDADLTDDVIIGGFAQCAGINISNSTLPNTTRLLKTLKLMLGEQATMMKDYWFRNRPYVQLGDSTIVPEDEDTYRDESSYPSGHAIIGWGMALVLTEVMPQYQNLFLKRGYDIGWSRVIAGYHYPADVQMGRIMAACLVTKMHNDTYFNGLLEAAKQEVATADLNAYSLSPRELPRGESLVPQRPDSSSITFATDFYRWIWGKNMRDTERGEIARHDSQCGIDHLCSIYSGVMGFDIDESNTPAIYNIITQSAKVGVNSAYAMIVPQSRKRPYELMNEQLWGDNETVPNLSDSVSLHPSAHAAMVWSTALALSQIAPQVQDTILARANQCATGDVIAGTCWQSDVDAAITCAGAAIACSYANPEYQTALSAAREEYMQIKGLSESEMTANFPDITKILDAPPAIDDCFFVGDLFSLWQAKELRSTERGELAKDDHSIRDDYFVNIFAECSPVVTISESETPNIVILIKFLKLMLNPRVTNLKSMVSRKRPFVALNEPVPYYGDEWTSWGESSYPSRRAFLGWSIALALAEVMPDCQDEILKRGYEYGESRIILGSNYASDVEAARVIAACDLGKLHNESMLKILYDNAKIEYKRKKDEAGMESVIASSRRNDTLWYSITGISYDSKPSTPGIYIHNGKKVTIK